MTWRSKMDWNLVKPFHWNLASIYFVHQCNTSVSLKLSWAWMLSAKQNLEWEKLLFLFCLHCSKLSRLPVKLLHLFCVTQENWLIRYRSEFVPSELQKHDNIAFYLWPLWLVSYILSLWVGSLSLLQICHEFERFSTYLPDIKVAVFYGGVNIKIHKDLLKNECPHIVVGTPGRVLALARDKELALRNVRHFILDECDKMLESLGTLIFLCHLYFLQNWIVLMSCVFEISYLYFVCLSVLQTWEETFRKFSKWLPMTNKLWCFLQHWARKSGLSARNLCKM